MSEKNSEQPTGGHHWAIDVLLVTIIFGFAAFYLSGFLWYIAGLTMCSLLLFLTIFGYVPIAVLTLVSVVFLLWRAFFRWQKAIGSRRRVFGLRLGMIILIFFLLWGTLSLSRPGLVPFTYGFRQRIRTTADINAIREWLTEVQADRDQGQNGKLVPTSERPASVRKLAPARCYVTGDSECGLLVSLSWGSGFAHWGLIVGAKDCPVPELVSDEYILLVEPGVYVWHEVQ